MTVGREVPEDGRRKAGEARQGARRRRGRPLPAEWQDPGWVRRRSGHTQEDARQVGAGQEARLAKARQGRGDAGAPQGGRAPQDGERVPKRSSRPPPREPSPGERMRLAGAKREGTPSGRCASCRSRRDPASTTGRGAPRRPSRAPRPRREPRRDGRGCPLGTSGAPARYGHGPWGLTPARRCTGCAGACVSRPCGARARRRPEGAARARPDAPRPPKPSPHHQAGRRRSPPEDRTGMALHGRGGRPVHAHGAGPGLPSAHGGRPADRRARAVPGARLRRARRDLSLGPRQPARTRGDGRLGARRTT